VAKQDTDIGRIRNLLAEALEVSPEVGGWVAFLQCLRPDTIGIPAIHMGLSLSCV